MEVDPHVAFNQFVTESIFIFDVCDTPAPPLPGSVWLDRARPLPEVASAALAFAINEVTPDCMKRALVLCDDTSKGRAQWMRDWLGRKDITVHAVNRAALGNEYGFCFGKHVTELVAYPNVILPGALYLGSKASANATALAELRITDVLSLLDRGFALSAEGVTSHKLCRLADSESENLTPVMLEALPFVRDALAAGRRVLVHCDRGASRSASVVLAHLMHTLGCGLDDALAFVRQQRPCVGPNEGFMRQLARRDWDATLTAAGGIAEPSPPPAPTTTTTTVIPPFEVIHGAAKRKAGDGIAPLVTAATPEIEIRSSWGALLEAEGGVTARQRELQGAAHEYAGDTRLLLVAGLFSPTECERLVQAADAVGFGRTNYPKHYRGNLRLITVDTSLAEAVWARLRPTLPATLDVDGAPFEAVGLNECWRLAKYHPGDRFGAHVDACFQRNDDELSMYTVNVYMRDVPPAAGGATRFYPGNGQRRYSPGEPVLSVAPEAGLAVIFRQPPGEQLLHDGEELSDGLKYLFRSDVMYRRVA